ncbi:CobW-like GTP-binding protein [Roseiconus lacunae]|uniref:CobW-like GTP-binding protein n=1 Tax=Roseiconus lacunae TaxID=2605694 RepID=UPI001E481074|nr:CobW-like GTP-binding protein [Roseiconus lacunae]MCD0462795.1 CobW-like GTP-binding protein [Roseiconus lacunae]
MSQPIRFIMVGGFLGAGKTTLISRLALHFQQQGKHVCVVTNDQAAGLVDTELLRSQGLNVNEVAGSCFCCNFHGLTDAMESFEKDQRPDIVLAEPVGSCTDLVATIALPMMERLGEKFVHSPYAVVLKPSHGMKILTGGNGRGFSEKAEYIFRKQLEESELILINRIDELTDAQQQQLRQSIEEQYPGRPVIGISAKTGENFEALYDVLAEDAGDRSHLMDVDYDVYAEGEAELGWLNATVKLSSTESVSIDDVAIQIVNDLRDRLLQIDAEPAHLKVLCSSSDAVAVANLVSSDTPTVLSVTSESNASSITILINARVSVAPETLQQIVSESVTQLGENHSATTSVETMESFRPGRPVPTFRAT